MELDNINLDSNINFSDFALFWLEYKVKPNCDINKCYKKYLGHLKKRIFPFLGNKKLNEINRHNLSIFFNNLKNSNTLYKNRNNKTLKPSSVKKFKAIINSILNYAVELEIINNNPCKFIKINYTTTYDIETIKDLVQQKRNKINYYNLEEYKRCCFLLENEIVSFYENKKISNNKKLLEIGRRIIILLAFKTGMRRSEIFGLSCSCGFCDLDLFSKEFDVNKSRHYAKNVGKYTKFCKNTSSIRRKSLPISLIPFLDLYFKFLKKIDYKEPYLFDFISIDGVCSFWDKWQKDNNLRNIRFHDIRHTHSTILLALGVDLKTISERLGHADIQMTFNTYADVLKELDVKASNSIDTL